jgi:hypothetical protein
VGKAVVRLVAREVDGTVSWSSCYRVADGGLALGLLVVGVVGVVELLVEPPVEAVASKFDGWIGWGGGRWAGRVDRGL